MNRFVRGAFVVLILTGCEGCHTNKPLTGDTFKRGQAVIIFPGIANTPTWVAHTAEMLEQEQVDRSVNIHIWGIPYFSLTNLHTYAANRERASRLAEEIAQLRRDHPEILIDILGYSGGAGFGAFVVESLPEGIAIDRLVLMAPALSSDYPLDMKVLPHVNDVVIIYASGRDQILKSGTVLFGNMDRSPRGCIGVSGSPTRHPRVLTLHWNESMVDLGHYGLHSTYTARNWQQRYLLPAFDHAKDVDDLKELFLSAGEDVVVAR